MNSYDQYCPESRQKCDTPYECAIKCRLNKPEPEPEPDFPEHSSMNWRDAFMDFIFLFVWWLWIIPVVVLVAAVAGLFFGFFG